MKPLSLLAVAALALHGGPALAGPERTEGDDSRLGLSLAVAGVATPAVSAAPSSAFPAATLPLLPPGVRSSQDRVALALSRTAPTGGDGDRVIERVEDADAADWLDVEYTVAPRLDERVRDIIALSRVRFGHVILLDPRTGEVLSYVSSDPDAFPPDRAYPTASLMKVVTAAATLRRAPGVLDGDCRYVGSPYQLDRATLEAPTRGGRVDTFWGALAISNNQCFARLAVSAVGEGGLLEEARRTGLLEAPAPRHPPGRVDPIEDAFDLGQLGSGLAGSFITPLGAARLAALLADGELVRPYWIARVRDAEGRVVAVPRPAGPHRVWPQAVADELRHRLVSVTTRGTARRAFHDETGLPRLGPIAVAGKTGTLSGREPEGRYEWFIGVAPADAPRIAIAAVVVNGPQRWSSASDVAAAALGEVFCTAEGCDPKNAAYLHERVETRQIEVARMLRDADLDETPRPVGVGGLDLPAHLLRRRVDGEIVLMLTLDENGDVVDAEVDSSDLPEFDEFVIDAVRDWRFTPPRHRGRPVTSMARLPIPIRIH